MNKPTEWYKSSLILKARNGPKFGLYIVRVVREITRQHWRRYTALQFVEGFSSSVDPTAIVDVDASSSFSLGKGCVVGRYTYIGASDNSYLVIEDNVYINEFNNVRAAGGNIRIGSGTIIAQFVSIIAANHAVPEQGQRISQSGYDTKHRDVSIGCDTWIAANVVILPGVEIGDGAVIGAGAVVTKSIPANAIAFGNPAKVVKFRLER